MSEKDRDSAPSGRRTRPGLGSYDDAEDEARARTRDARRDDEWRRERDEGFPVSAPDSGPGDATKRAPSREHVALGKGEDERELAEREGHPGGAGRAAAPDPASEWRSDDSPGPDGLTGREQMSWGQGGYVGPERYGAERYGEPVARGEDDEDLGAFGPDMAGAYGDEMADMRRKGGGEGAGDEPFDAAAHDEAYRRWRDHHLAEVDRRYDSWRREQARQMDLAHRRWQQDRAAAPGSPGPASTHSTIPSSTPSSTLAPRPAPGRAPDLDPDEDPDAGPGGTAEALLGGRPRGR